MISVAGGVTISCGLVCLSVGGSSRVAITREVKITATQRTSEPARMTCPGGIDYPADVQLVPDAVVTTAGRESVEYHAEINVHRGKAVGLAWEADVIDDRGRMISSRLAPGTTRAKAGDANATGAILAQQLPDGFYMLRVRVAVSPDDAPATVMQAIQYANVNGGKWREMDQVQWAAESNARLAFRAVTQPTVKGGR